MEDIRAISSKITITSSTTRFSDGDPAGIVYFANYPMYFDESFIQIAKRHGFDWGQRDMRFIIPIVEQKSNYVKPLVVGQEYNVATAITHTGKRSFQSSHAIFVDNNSNYQLMAHGYINRVVVDPTSFKAMEIPNDLSDAFDQYQVDSETWNALLSFLS